MSLPGPGEAFFGRVDGTAPAGAVQALINVNGVRAVSATVAGGRFSAAVTARAGNPLVEALFVDSGGKQIGAAVSRSAWLLPSSAALQPAPVRINRALSTQLATVGLGFDGYAAIHTARLATGAVAGWNDDAPFPAASTVKLAVMIEAAHRYGLATSSPVLYDVERAAAWSSNLAANRLFKTIGHGSASRGVTAAESRLRSIGARSSTYPGEYRAGTSRTDAPRKPPLNTARVTTARDLASVLRAIHLAATGRGATRAPWRPSTAPLPVRETPAHS